MTADALLLERERAIATLERLLEEARRPQRGGAEAELLLAEGRAAEALEQAERMGATARHVLHPDWKPWQSLKARALALLGRGKEARTAIEAELELARGVGGRRVVGRCLRQLAALEGEAGEERLNEAIELLGEHAGAARAGPRAGRPRRPAAAHPPADRGARAAAPGARAGRGLRLPTAGGERALRAVRHRRPPAHHRARGRRVADRARAARRDPGRRRPDQPRDRADLFVTPKTVEVHLSSAYRKLDIRSRRELAGALGS